MGNVVQEVTEFTGEEVDPGSLSHRRTKVALLFDAFCAVAREAPIYFRWRPFLTDPGDDLVFECSLASGATHIVTHNLPDFAGVSDFGISVMTAADFLGILPAS